MTCRKAVVLNGISTIKAGSRHSEKKVVKCCRTGMGRSWSREEAGLDKEQEQSSSRGGSRIREGGAGHEQGMSKRRTEAGAGQEQGKSRKTAGVGQ